MKSIFHWILFMTLLMVDNFATAVINQSLPLNFSNIPTDYSVINYAMGFTFSHDGRLFASFFSGKEDLKDFDQHINGTIKIWNTQTGQLVYQTVVPYYMNTYQGGQYDIAFSPDDKLLLTSSGEKADLILWNYAETNNIKKNCQLGSRGESENILQINENNNIFLAKGMNFTKLCTEQGEINLYPVSHSTWFESTASRLLFNNKMLVIYNVRTVNVPEPRLDKELKNFKSENRKFIDFWNLNYISEADTLLKAFDTKKQLFILFEVFGNKLEINQWNYANKKWLGKQTFPSLSIKPLSEPQSALYFSDNYLLIREKNEQLTLFKRENQQFIELWTKPIPSLIAVSKIYFSQDERFIVLDDFTLLDMQTGKLTSHYPANLATDVKKYTVLIEPALKEVAERFNMPFLQGNHFISNYDADLRCANSVTFKTQLYSLTANKIIKEIDGLVLDISPDGKTLAACKGSELFLMPTKP